MAPVPSPHPGAHPPAWRHRLLSGRDSPVAVVGELIVTGEGDEHPKAHAQREAYLDGRIYPDLQEQRQSEHSPQGEVPEGRQRGWAALEGRQGVSGPWGDTELDERSLRRDRGGERPPRGDGVSGSRGETCFYSIHQNGKHWIFKCPLEFNENDNWYFWTGYSGLLISLASNLSSELVPQREKVLEKTLWVLGPVLSDLLESTE